MTDLPVRSAGSCGGTPPLRRNGILLAAGVALAAVAILYLVRESVQSVREAGGISALLDFDPLLLLASMALLQIHFAFAALSWKRVTGLSGGRLSYRQAYSIHFVSLLGKYIPGKVWAAVGKIGLSGSAGVPSASAGRALVLETLFIATGSMLLGLPLVPLISGSLGIDLLLSFAAVTAVISALLLTAHPGAHRRIASIASRITGRNLDCVDPGFHRVLRLLPLYIFIFLLLGLSFHLLALSFGVHLPLWPGLALFPTAIGVGFLVLLAPAGIGVSEVTLVWLMGLVAPTGEKGLLPVLALASRLWLTLSEAMAFGAAVALWGGRGAILAGLRRGGSDQEGTSVSPPASR